MPNNTHLLAGVLALTALLEKRSRRSAPPEPRPSSPSRPSQEDPLVRALHGLRYGTEAAPRRNTGYSNQAVVVPAPVRAAITHRLWKLLSQSQCPAEGLRIERAFTQGATISVPLRATRIFVSITRIERWAFAVYLEGEEEAPVWTFSEARTRLEQYLHGDTP